MKAVILAGGLGTRLSEETDIRPKPMVEIGGMPIIWHVMKIYSHYGIRDFIVCLGYRGYVIKEYFTNYHRHMSDLTVNTLTGDTQLHRAGDENWNVTLVETGRNTMTGGRIKRIRDFLDGEDFCLTYGDGVAAIDIRRLVDFHKTSGRLATVTAVRPPGRFGALQISGDAVNSFLEKPPGDNAYVNGGFFVLSPKVIDRISGDETLWENEPLQGLAQSGQLSAFRHDGFWLAMDTLRDRMVLESLWSTGEAKWKVW